MSMKVRSTQQLSLVMKSLAQMSSCQLLCSVVANVQRLLKRTNLQNVVGGRNTVNELFVIKN